MLAKSTSGLPGHLSGRRLRACRSGEASIPVAGLVAGVASTVGDPVAAVAGLLRTRLGPVADSAASSEVVAAWLAVKADLLERVATASADPVLAARAAVCAAHARAASSAALVEGTSS
jgi:hypothetical protein